ncbi:MAG: PAS domain S-box protein [Bacteroidota bacterium]
MRNGIRKTGITAIGDCPWGTHFCLFYRDREDLMDILAPYFQAGLENNELCRWVTSEPLEGASARRALERKLKSPGQSFEKRQLDIIDYRQQHIRSGQYEADKVLSGCVEMVNQAVKDGYDGLRLAGDAFWYEKENWKEFTEYEATVNSVIGNYPMIALCAYSLEKREAADIIDVVSTHQFALTRREGRWEQIDSLECKRTEEALRESEEPLGVLIENSNDGIALLNSIGTVLYEGPPLSRILGYSPEERTGKNAFDLIHANDIQRINQLYAELLQKPAAGITTQLRVRHKNGSWKWLEVVASNLLTVPGVEAVIINYRDITTRKIVDEALQSSEARFRRLFEAAKDGILILDAETGRIEDVNQFLVDLLGYPRTELLGRTLSEIGPSSNIEATKKAFGELQTREYIRFEDLPLETKDGRRIDVEFVSNVYKVNHKKVIQCNIRDITKRRRAEEVLRQNREWLKAMFDASRDGIVGEENGIIVYANISFAKIHGYDHTDELIGRPISVVQSDQIDKSMLEYGKKCLRGESEPSIREFKGKRRDGALVDLEASVSTFSMGDKQYIISVVRDIAERKRTERALRESEERLRILFEYAPDGYFLIDLNGNLIDRNKASENLTGYKREELIGKSFLNLDLLGKEQLPKVTALLKEDGLGRPTGPEEFTLNRKQGDHVLVEIRTFPVKIKDEVVVLGSAREITERRLAQETLSQERNLLRTLIDNLPDQIYVKDRQGRFLLCNKGVARLAGADIPDEIIGKTDLDLFPEDLAVEYARDEELVVRTGQPLLDKEELNVDRSGARRWVLTTKVPLRDVTGEIVGLVGINRDITERKQLEQQLIQAQKMESLGTLASGIAHDFNNILGIILGYASLLELAGPDRKQFARNVDTIKKAVERGTGLVRQLLISVRKTEVLLESVDLNAVVCELQKMLQETFPRMVTFSVQLHRHIPSIIGDRNQIYQTLLNLCLNARDAMPKGGVLTLKTGTVGGETLREKFSNVDSEEYVWVSVGDTGVGMDEETKRRIFEPFFTTKGPGKGTGLGLYVVYGIVKNHYGFIDAESETNRGTTFHLYFPVQPRGIELGATKESLEAEVPRGSETIFVVEDEEMMLEMLKTTLKSKGYNVLKARDGVSAVRTYRHQREKIDLVVMDLGLPERGGWEAFQKMKGINPEVKVILVSGYIDPNLKSELLNSGVKDFVQKPYKPEHILKEIRKVLDAPISS